MNNKVAFGDPVWEKLFQKGWGKYPPEEVVRFFFRVKNEFSCPKVLDIGCGQGACAWFLAKEGGQVTAFDGALTGLKNVSEIAREFGVSNKFNLVHGDITSPGEFISGTFDILLDNYSLYANPEEDLCRALSEYYNFINCGNYLLMNCFGDKTTGYGTGTQLSVNTFRDVEGSLKDRGIVTWFNRIRLNDLLENIGYKLVYVEDLIMENNMIVTERLITCLEK